MSETVNPTTQQQIEAPVDLAAVANTPTTLRRVYRYLKRNSISGPIVRSCAGFFIEHIHAPGLHRSRVANVLKSPDFKRIKQAPGAGKVRRNILTMHNGMQVHANSYYDHNMRYVLTRTAGIHEPRQEYIFGLVLDTIKPGGVMIELGAFWAFYSLWFMNRVKDGRAVMVEPDPERRDSGIRNFKLNNLTGTFLSGYVGRDSGISSDGIPVLSIGSILESTGLEYVSVLHSDIQGAELSMLEGATDFLEDGKIEYLFLSTHSEQLHSACAEFMSRFNYRLLEDIPCFASDSEDGLLVFQHRTLSSPEIETA